MKRRKYRNWKSVFADWKESGLSDLEYCKQKGISAGLFRRHLRKFDHDSKPKEEKAVTELIAKSPTTFIEMTTEPERDMIQCLKITTRYGCVLEIPL